MSPQQVEKRTREHGWMVAVRCQLSVGDVGGDSAN